MKKQNAELSAEDVVNWFIDDLIRETELAINVSKGKHFEAALTLINEASNKYSQNKEETLTYLRESLTKITTEASYAFNKL